MKKKIKLKWFCSVCGKEGDVSEISEDGKSCDFNPSCDCPLEKITAIPKPQEDRCDEIHKKLIDAKFKPLKDKE